MVDGYTQVAYCPECLQHISGTGPIVKSSGNCCDGKAVSLNHRNKGTTHLADDIPLKNEDALIQPFVELTKTMVVGRSTRSARSVQTQTTPISTV